MRGATPPLLHTQTFMPQEEFETMTQMFENTVIGTNMHRAAQNINNMETV
jgi:hypothetical protein